MPWMDEDIANMFLATAGVREGRLTLAEAVAEIESICDSRPPLPYGEDDYLQIRTVLDSPLPADEDGTEARCERLDREVALINLHRDIARR